MLKLLSNTLCIIFNLCILYLSPRIIVKVVCSLILWFWSSAYFNLDAEGIHLNTYIFKCFCFLWFCDSWSSAYFNLDASWRNKFEHVYHHVWPIWPLHVHVYQMFLSSVILWFVKICIIFICLYSNSGVKGINLNTFWVLWICDSWSSAYIYSNSDTEAEGIHFVSKLNNQCKPTSI